MSFANQALGICPGCDGPGTVAAPCETPRCRRHGYRPIPQVHYDRACAPGRRLDPLVGQQWGKYLLVEPLGSGGMGSVYLSLQAPIGLKAAVKILGDSPAAAALGNRFQGEAEALARLNHPNIVRLLDFGVHERRSFLVMEYVEGGRTLDAALAAGIPAEAIRPILRQLIHALAAAHDSGIVHRDIKPQNVMLQTVPGNPWLLRLVDFGLAKSTSEGQETRLIAGTPAFMAPEQLLRTNIGPWTDLYAAGVIAYRLLMGRPLYRGAEPDQILTAKLQPGHDPTAHLEAEGVPPCLRAFFRRALAPSPADRIASAETFLEALEVLFGALDAGSRAWAGSGEPEPVDRRTRVEVPPADDRRHRPSASDAAQRSTRVERRASVPLDEDALPATIGFADPADATSAPEPPAPAPKPPAPAPKPPAEDTYPAGQARDRSSIANARGGLHRWAGAAAVIGASAVATIWWLRTPEPASPVPRLAASAGTTLVVPAADPPPASPRPPSTEAHAAAEADVGASAPAVPSAPTPAAESAPVPAVVSAPAKPAGLTLVDPFGADDVPAVVSAPAKPARGATPERRPAPVRPATGGGAGHARPAASAPAPTPAAPPPASAPPKPRIERL